MKSRNVYSNKEVRTTEDAEGNVTITTTEKTTSVRASNEPDFIKIYTHMWCEANGIPDKWRGLFLEVASRMTYCNANDLQHAQLFVTSKLIQQDICAALGWAAKDGGTYKKGLAALCKCGALRHICRSTYQVNPEYAGRGEWRYNPHYKRGGVEELVTTFKMNAQGVHADTQIVWAGDHSDEDPMGKMYAAGMGLKPKESGIIKETTITQPSSGSGENEIPGQLSLDEVFPGTGAGIPDDMQDLPFMNDVAV